MQITVVEGPRTVAFTTLTRAKGELGIRGTETDVTLQRLIDEVSDSIAEYTRRPWARQQVTERLVGYGTDTMAVSVTPVVTRPSEVRFRDTPMSGYDVADPDAGFIYRLDGFADTRVYTQWVERELDVRSRGDAAWAFDYIGGYLMPGDDMYVAPSGISAIAADSAFELTVVDGSENRFPLLVSGEYVRMMGFTTSANNGRFRVLRRTPGQLVVAAVLTDEANAEIVTVNCRTLPRNLEGLALVELRARYFALTRDPSLTSEKIGDWAGSYVTPTGADPNAANFGGLIPKVARELDKYTRSEL